MLSSLEFTKVAKLNADVWCLLCYQISLYYRDVNRVLFYSLTPTAAMPN